LEVAVYFGLDNKLAKQEIRRIADIVKDWRKYAVTRHAPRSEVELMARAFEHNELKSALSL
jgi:hypothetical protein